MKWWNIKMVQWWNVEMVKWFIRAESVASVPFPFTKTIYQQDSSVGYFKRAVLHNSSLVVGCTAEA